jgi:hypothetical protein
VPFDSHGSARRSKHPDKPGVATADAHRGVYFTGELWRLAARLTRQRLWHTIGFLAEVTIIFVVTTIRDEVRALRDERAEQTDPAKLLEGTPLAAADGHAPARTPLSLAGAGQRRRGDGGFAGGAIHRRSVRLRSGPRHRPVPHDVAVLWSSEETSPVGEPPCAGTCRHPRARPADHRARVAVRGRAVGFCTSPSAPASTPCIASGSSTHSLPTLRSASPDVTPTWNRG